MISTSRRVARGIQGAAAFTLVEILVAIVILALITLVMAAIFGGAQTLVSQSNTSMGSLDAGEAVLSQLGLDITRMVVRDDVDFDFTKQTGNDRLSFYARTSGFDASGNSTSYPRPLSVVSYQVGTNPANASNLALQLNYGALQIDWGVTSTSTLTAFKTSKSVSGTQTQYLDPALGGDLPLPSSYTTLANEVIRFEFSCVLKVDPNGNNSPPQLLTTSVPTSGLPVVVGGSTYIAPPIENIAGILVGIVVVDPRSRVLFPPGSDVKLSKLFADPTTNNEDFLTLWSPSLTPANLTSAGIPTKAITGIHIYQRFYPLPW